ncbi:MAG: antirestriction protein ArdA [Hyphomonadaceae bacterium]
MTSRTAPRTDAPRIYVACLAAYNNGILHGEWIAASDPDQIREEVRDMLAASPIPDAEEWAIHDHEGFEGVSLSEYASFETVCALAEFLSEHGKLGAKVYEHFGSDLDAANAAFEDYAGEYKTAADFAEEITRESGTPIPDSLEHYIDWEALARDMEMNGGILVIEMRFDEVHIFWQR